MSSQTHTLELNAPAEKVFEFLSKVENLPKWAVVFCLGIERRDGRWWVKTPDGELLFRIEADARTRVVDMYFGPAEDKMMVAPARVVGLPDRRSLFLFTVIRYPGMTDESLKAQCEPLVAKEFPALRRHVE
ncbi:MAG TPA: hypothetical protein VJS20_03385 [Gemmatimonadales bacterium]|nr:hypothetical protein [Gemmatimonadales bacterium]